MSAVSETPHAAWRWRWGVGETRQRLTQHSCPYVAMCLKKPKFRQLLNTSTVTPVRVIPLKSGYFSLRVIQTEFSRCETILDPWGKKKLTPKTSGLWTCAADLIVALLCLSTNSDVNNFNDNDDSDISGPRGAVCWGGCSGPRQIAILRPTAAFVNQYKKLR